MKKIKRFIFIAITWIFIFTIISIQLHSKIFLEKKSIKTENVMANSIGSEALSDVQKALKEVAYSYYMRGTNIQYNSWKRSDSTYAPEEATSQNKNYMVCSGFCESVYKELLGIEIPRATERLIKYASDYKGIRPEVIGYGIKGSDNYISMKLYENGTLKSTINNPSINQIIPYLRCGDVLTYSGHTMMVYDLEYTDGQITDAIMLHSQAAGGKYYSQSKISDKIVIDNTTSFGSLTHFLYYIRNNNTNFEDGVTEGSINMIKISEEDSWGGIKNNVKKRNEYSILRFITNDAQGNSYLNYNGTDNYDTNHENELITLSNKDMDRLKFNKLFIEKTIDAFADSVVEPNDTLTYTITIKNRSKTNYTEDLNVTENISQYVTYKSNKVYKNDTEINLECNTTQENGEYKLAWNIGKLNSGDEIKINYTVQVKKNTYGNTISSTGKVENIPSANVKNVIGNNLTSIEKETLKNAYNNYTGNKKGKELIDEIYQSIGKTLNLKDFNIENLIEDTDKTSTNYRTISLKNTDPFYNSVLNKYWSSMKKQKYTVASGDIYYYDLKNWRPYTNIDRRADTVFDEHLQTGDILIYKNEDDNKYSYSNNTITKTAVTDENGEYAYIFIEGIGGVEGKNGFVGINLGKDGTANTKDDRNEFNKEYYSNKGLTLYAYSNTTNEALLNYINYQTLFGKDYYIILRPSLAFEVTPEGKPGDINENDDIDIGDILMLYRHISQANSSSVKERYPGWELSNEKKTIGDVNKNDNIDIGDILKLKRYMAAKNNTSVATQHPSWLILE